MPPPPQPLPQLNLSTITKIHPLCSRAFESDFYSWTNPGLSRVKKDSSGKTTMSPITDAERLAVLPEFFQKYVEAREAAAAPLDLSEITSIMG